MQIKIIEAAHPVTEMNSMGGNWGEFMLVRFDSEFEYKSALPGFEGISLLRARGWSPRNLLFLDIETCEGAVLTPGGSASADLNKHEVWVCPMAEPFLVWLYQQDLGDLGALPSYVELPEAAFAMAGYRRKGLRGELERAVYDIIAAAKAGDWEGPELPEGVAGAIAHAQLVLNQLHPDQPT